MRTPKPLLRRKISEKQASWTERPFHPEAGAAGCQLLNEDGSLQLSCGRLPRLSSIFLGGEVCNNIFRKIFRNKIFFAEYGLSSEDHQRIQDVDFVKGCCLIIRKSVLKQTGYLDENIFMFIHFN